MRTEDLFPLWCWIDDQEHAGRIAGIDAAEAKARIYLVMQERGLEPDDVVVASGMIARCSGMAP